MLLTKRAHHCAIFQTLSALWNFTQLIMLFLKPQGQGLFRFCMHHCSMSWKVTPLYFLAQTSYTLRKNSPSVWNLWTFEWLSFLESRVSFSSNFTSLFSVMKHNSSIFFHLNLYMFWKKEPDQSPNFQTLDCSHEN